MRDAWKLLVFSLGWIPEWNWGETASYTVISPPCSHPPPPPPQLCSNHCNHPPPQPVSTSAVSKIIIFLISRNYFSFLQKLRKSKFVLGEIFFLFFCETTAKSTLVGTLPRTLPFLAPLLPSLNLCALTSGTGDRILRFFVRLLYRHYFLLLATSSSSPTLSFIKNLIKICFFC